MKIVALLIKCIIEVAVKLISIKISCGYIRNMMKFHIKNGGNLTSTQSFSVSVSLKEIINNLGFQIAYNFTTNIYKKYNYSSSIIVITFFFLPSYTVTHAAYSEQLIQLRTLQQVYTIGRLLIEYHNGHIYQLSQISMNNNITRHLVYNVKY